MDTPARISSSVRSHPFSQALLLMAAWTAFGPLVTVLSADSREEQSRPAVRSEAPRTPGAGVESLPGIPIYPGSELIALEGPSLELVDLQRPGWEFTAAEVLVADFLVGDPLSELRTYYRNLCVRDPLLLLVKVNSPAGEIVSVRYARRHPLHPRKRWLRIITYRLPPIPDVHRDGE